MENLIFSAILYLIPLLFFYCPIIKALHNAIERDRSKTVRLNNIPFASFNELIAIAKEFKVIVPLQIERYNLQNILIAELC
ncbi:hypothetical protein [Myxosarcina sp. GI1]|uniref:hypothetical protein n=1 Tax=Myxosarcina sp. GI1 TaxID=1541065 RepID=UPI0005672591|nr:hypothetical protein [Myxosarcina sp. GI1]